MIHEKAHAELLGAGIYLPLCRHGKAFIIRYEALHYQIRHPRRALLSYLQHATLLPLAYWAISSWMFLVFVCFYIMFK